MKDKKYTLWMQIQANGEKAMAELKRVGSQVEHFGKTARSVGGGAGAVLSFGGKTLDFITKPLQLAGKLGAGAAAGFVAIATKSLVARSSMEQLELRLEGVTGSAQAARAAMEEIAGLTGKKLFEDEQLVEARIGLQQIGVTGRAAMQAVVDTAAATGQGVEAVVLTIAQMSDRTLKRMGIDVEKNGDQTVLSYKNQMGQIVKVASKTEDDARRALVGIFGGKFGGSAGRQMGNTIFGSFRNLSETLDDAMKSFGQGMAPAAIAFMNSLTNGLDSLFGGGKPEEWGKKVGQVFGDALDIGQQLIDDPEKLRKALGAAMQFAAGAFVIYLETMGGALMGIAKMMAGAFIEAVLASDLPGTGSLRKKMYIEKNGLSRMGGLAYEKTPEFKAFIAQTPAQQAAYLTQGKEQTFSAGMAQTGEALLAVPGKLAALSASTFGATGIQARPRYDYAGGEANMPRAPRVARRTSSGAGMATESWNEFSPTARGGPVIHIGSLTVRANDLQQFQNSLINQVLGPNMAPAGT